MKRSLRVAVLAACPFPSHQGTQVFVRHLADAQSRYGHEIELFSYGYGDRGEQTNFTHRPVRCLDAGLRSGPSLKRLLNDGLLALGLRRALKKKPFDILHVHNVEGLLIGLGLKLTGLQVPLVYHAHNSMREELPTYFSGTLVRWGMRIAGELFDYCVPRYADAQIVFDNAHREHQIRRGASHREVFVAAPALDGDELRAVEAGPVDLPEGRYVVYCGNPDGYQNLELLWEAWAMASQALPGVRLLILSRAESSDFIREDFDYGRVIFRQYRNRDEMVRFMKRAEVGVSSRVLGTGFPVKLISYLQLGLKAVACRSSVQVPYLEGLWLSRPDPVSFAEQLIEAMGAIDKQPSPMVFEVDDSLEAYNRAYRFALKDEARV